MTTARTVLPVTESTPQQYVYVKQPTSGAAVAALVFGIVGLLVGWCTFAIPSIIAVFCGHAGIKETKNGQIAGHAMAMAGLILGYFVTIPALLISILFVIGGGMSALSS